MTLEIIRTQTTWNDAAGSINSNYAKIADAIAQLKANGGGGGGGADIDLTDYATKVWVEAKGYITASTLTPYALKTDIPSLVGYATEDFVDNKLVDYAPLTSVQGFENRIGGLEGAVPQLNERVTTVEGKVSSLNETVSTGKNNLLDRVNVIEEEYATKTYVDNAIGGIDLSAYLLKADLTKSRIQSTLGISDWALAAIKPSYAWSEITSRPTALSQFTDDVVAGKYLPLTGGIIRNDSDATPLTIASSAQAYTAMCFINKHNEQGFFLYAGGSDYGVTAAGWTATYTLIHSGNIGNYKSGDSAKLGGYDISRFLLTTKRDYNSMDLNTIGDKQSIFTEIRTGEVTTSNCPISGYGALLSLKDGNSYAKMQIVSSSGSADTYIRCVQGGGSTISANWQRIITDSNIGNYNAGSATKLQTPRKLWGNSFDGTAKIGGDITLDAFQDGRQLSIQQSGEIKFSTPPDNGWVTSLSIYANDKTTLLTSAFGVYGRREDVQYAFIGGTYDNPNVVVKDNTGNVGIGNSSPTERLDVSGNIKASGNINATSITINGVTITASNGTITVNGNVFATGAITAKAVG